MPERSGWLYSTARNRLFEICSWFTLVHLALLVFGLVAGSVLDPISIESRSWPVWVAVGFAFALVGICLVSQFILWISMVVWSAFWSEEWFVLRILMVLAQLLTFNFGSSLIYLFIYRPRHERIQRRVAAQAGVSA
jgi:hypothetical protein